ncbi:MAG: acetate--CoA ligase family protein [Candidatus Bathycorpusculaceae bacterium]
MNSSPLDLMFKPRTVALIGASEDRLKSGGMFLNSFIECGLKSKFFPVNPKGGEIRGFKAYPSVLDIPDEIDLAIIAIPAYATPKAVEECAKKGVKFVVIHSAGFGEIGDDGKRIEKEMVQTARKEGTRVVGPNCMGLYCPETGLNTILPYIGGLTKESGDVAVVSQSGWVSEHLIIVGYERGLRFSKVLSIGNQSDLTFTETLQYLGSDPETNIIVAYIEGIKDGKTFLKVAKEASLDKPVIVWKAGKTEAAARAAFSHTGSLAGNYAVHEAAFKQAGVISVHGIEELLDITMAFKCPYLPDGIRVGIIVGAGGAGVAASDACEMLSLKVERLPEEAITDLKGLLKDVIPTLSGLYNPVDLVWLPFGQASKIHPQIIEVMSKTVDAFMILEYDPFTTITREVFAEEYREAMLKTIEKIKKPMMFVAPHPTKDLDISPWTKSGLPVYPTPERAAKALSALAQRSKFLKTQK